MTAGKDVGARMLPLGVHDAPDGYQNLVRIGKGGSASVYRALDTRFGRIVALKILHSDSLNERQRRRFNAECLATGRVSSHPNIVTVYDAGITSGHRPWLAMEHCTGGSLAQKVSSQGPLPVAEVISIGARLCEALSAAHEAGILHRDVKPHNVLLTSYGEPALADFGIASVRNGDDTGGETTGQSAAYTVVHAAPEILEGKAGTAAADIYSLGSTLYTLLAGQAPFAREAGIGLAPLVTRILRNDLPPIARPGIPPELEQLLRTSMAAQPQDRPTSAAELGESLTSLGLRLADDQGPAGPPTSIQAASAPPARSASAPPAHSAVRPPVSARRLLLTLGGALGIMVTVFTAWGSGLHGPARGGLSTGPSAQGMTQTTAQTTTQTGPPGSARAADRYSPKDLVVSPGHNSGELLVTWGMPIRPDVVATVVYTDHGTPGAARARAVVSYDRTAQGAPVATLHGLPSKMRVCVSAAHVVSVGDRVTNAVSRPVCAVPR